MEYTLQQLIDKTLALRKIWDQRRVEAETQIKSLDAKLAVYQTAIKNYWEHIDENDKYD